MVQQRPLWLAFLDIEGAYDHIDQDLLSEILEEAGVSEDCVERLREIYKDNQFQLVRISSRNGAKQTRTTEKRTGQALCFCVVLISFALCLLEIRTNWPKPRSCCTKLRGKAEQAGSQFISTGCPLSPLLFTLYVAGMERRLQGSKIGFGLPHKRGGQVVEQRIPGTT